MNIFNDMVSGAAKQFGREFGRAGANSILKGANSYNVNVSDYSGRIKPSDSTIVKNIKTLQKVNFVTTNKANISRLIQITDLVNDSLVFNGDSSLNEVKDVKELIDQYNDKFEHGSAMVDDNYEDKSVDYLKEKRQEFVSLLEKFNSDLKSFVTTNLKVATEKRKSKKVATWLSFPFLIGGFGVYHFYLGNIAYGVLSLLFFWTAIPTVISLIDFIKIVTMSVNKFDLKFNNDYVFYNQFVK